MIHRPTAFTKRTLLLTAVVICMRLDRRLNSNPKRQDRISQLPRSPERGWWSVSMVFITETSSATIAAGCAEIPCIHPLCSMEYNWLHMLSCSDEATQNRVICKLPASYLWGASLRTNASSCVIYVTSDIDLDLAGEEYLASDISGHRCPAALPVKGARRQKWDNHHLSLPWSCRLQMCCMLDSKSLNELWNRIRWHGGGRQINEFRTFWSKVG